MSFSFFFLLFIFLLLYCLINQFVFLFLFCFHSSTNITRCTTKWSSSRKKRKHSNSRMQSIRKSGSINLLVQKGIKAAKMCILFIGICYFEWFFYFLPLSQYFVLFCVYHFTIFVCIQDIFSGTTHLSDSPTLILDRVDRHHAGVYQCAADNGVREPVSMDINLTILCEWAKKEKKIEKKTNNEIKMRNFLLSVFVWCLLSHKNKSKREKKFYFVYSTSGNYSWTKLGTRKRRSWCGIGLYCSRRCDIRCEYWTKKYKNDFLSPFLFLQQFFFLFLFCCYKNDGKLANVEAFWVQCRRQFSICNQICMFFQQNFLVFFLYSLFCYEFEQNTQHAVI